MSNMRLPNQLTLSLAITAVLIIQTTGDFPSGAHQAVRCMLAHEAPEDCASLPKVIVPSYLLQEYNDSPLSLHEALRKSTLAQLTDHQVASIPVSLLYLIPRARLADLTMNQLSTILQKHAGDTSIAHQVAACLQHDNNMLKFIEKMNVSIPEETLQILAESMEIADLTEGFLKLEFIEHKPLLAYLKPTVLFKVETTTLYSIFNVLRMAESKPPKKSAFYFLTEAAIKHRAPLSKLKGFVMGLSSDQILNESLLFDVSVSDFRQDLSFLQARALFEKSYHNLSLSISNFIDSKPLLYKLSPELLQMFPQNVQKYEVNFIEHIGSIPLPTALQITEYVKADCIKTRRLPKDDEFWDKSIRNLGKWVYTLPLSSLEGYKYSMLNTAILKTLESLAISPMQAFYLTARGEALDIMTPNSILDLETFLHALPASQLVNRKLGEIKYAVKLLLASKLPANNLARTLSLVNNIASSIGDPAEDNAGDGSILEELLGNKDINQMMSLLSPKDLALSAEAMLKFFADDKIRNLYSRSIEQLPQQILAVLLDHDRQLRTGKWSWKHLLESSLVSNLLVGGLTCQHIEEMDTGLFIPIMARYNTIRKKLFSKNLQHCCLQKLISHLKLKMTLSQTESDSGLISLLEPIEIESIGAYGLLDIPVDALQVSPYLGHILSKIGQLSNTELMLSTDISKLKMIAELGIEKDGNANTFVLHNLVWFLPETVHTPDLRLMLEAKLLDTTICLPIEQRLQVAARLIKEFGSPEQWSAGVLASLQDLLVVFSEEQLSSIPLSSWTKAADSLISQYDLLVDWVQPASFYKVCANLLGHTEGNYYKEALSRFIHWKLIAAQKMLDLVVSLPYTAEIKQNYMYGGSNMPLTVFNPKVDELSESTEESTSEESTTEQSTTENSTTEKHTTEESTTEESTTEEITTEKSTTQKLTTKKSLMEQSTTEESTTEKSTTEKSATGESTTEKALTEISETKVKSELHVPNNTETKSSTQKNISPFKFEEDSPHSKGEMYPSQKLGEDRVLFSNGSTEKPVLTNVTLESVKNAHMLKINGTKIPDLISPKLDNITKPILLCANSVNKEECKNNSVSLNSTDIKFNFSKTTNKTDNTTDKNSNYNVQEIQKSVNLIASNKTNNLPPHNVSTVPNIVKKDEVISNISSESGNVSSTVPSKSQNDTYYEHYLISNSTLPPNTVDDNLSPKISLLGDDFTDENSKKKPDKQSENESDELEEEEEIPEVNSGNHGILIDSQRKKRSFFSDSTETKLSCNAIKMVGSLAELALTTSDLSEMEVTDIADCREEFGAMDLSEPLQKIIWKRIDNELKMDGIHLLGKLLRVSSWPDIWDINFRASQPWVLETIHAIIQNNNNTMVMKKFLEEVGKRNAELSVDLLAVLGPAVCSLDPQGLKALSVVGLDLGQTCPSCLPYLAGRAIDELGSVTSWTQHFLYSVKAIAAGLDLDSWKQLAASEHKPLTGLQPSAVKCLNNSHLEVLSPDQIRMIPTVSLLALSDQQLGALNADQLQAVKSVTHPTVNEKMTPTKRVYVAGVPIPSGASSKTFHNATLIGFLMFIYFSDLQTLISIKYQNLSFL